MAQGNVRQFKVCTPFTCFFPWYQPFPVFSSSYRFAPISSWWMPLQVCGSLFLPVWQDSGGSVPSASTLLESFWDLPSVTEERQIFSIFSVLQVTWIWYFRLCLNTVRSHQETKEFPNYRVHLKRSRLSLSYCTAPWSPVSKTAVMSHNTQ